MKDHNKTRTGCVTCKSRRVKCDEVKPECLRCQRIGQKCGGYNPPKTWMFDPTPKRSEALVQTRHSSSLDDSQSSRSYPLQFPPTHYQGTYDERRSFEFYDRHTIPVLEIAAREDVDLFSRLVPQLSHQMPAIRSALLSISAFFQALIDPVRAQEHRTFAHAHYVKTIRLIASPKQPGVKLVLEEILLASILLRCIESHRHDYTRAIVHMNGALAIIASKHRFTGPQEIEDALKHLVDRLGTKALASTGEEGILKSESQPQPLHSGLDALNQFNWVLLEICRTLAESRTSSLSELESSLAGYRCLQRLDQWYLDLTKILQDHPDKAKDPSAIYAQINYHLVCLVLSSLTYPPLTRFDQFNANFRKILSLCHSFQQLNERREITYFFKSRPIRLGFAIELVLIVFFVAYHCRDPSIRRWAISFLRQSYRRELGWESFQSATIAEWIMYHEEEGLLQPPSAGAISESKRIRLLSVSYYRELECDADWFKRPSWAFVQFEQGGYKGERWLDLEDDEEDVPARRMAFSKPEGLSFRYRCEEPFMPTAPTAVALAYEKGVMEPKSTITAVPDPPFTGQYRAGSSEPPLQYTASAAAFSSGASSCQREPDRTVPERKDSNHQSRRSFKKPNCG